MLTGIMRESNHNGCQPRSRFNMDIWMGLEETRNTVYINSSTAVFKRPLKHTFSNKVFTDCFHHISAIV